MVSSALRRFVKRFFVFLNILLVLVFLVACLTPIVNPSEWWIHGFFSLATPYLVVLLLMTLVFWLITKPIWALLPFLTLCLGYQQVSVVFAWNGNTLFTKRKPENCLRIVNWNIQGFNGMSRSKNLKNLVREEIAASILKFKPDVICLQEFNSGQWENNIALFTPTHPYHYFSKDFSSNNGQYHSGSIIFSKYPMLDSGRLAYPNEESLIFADLKKGNQTIRVYTTHLQSFKFKENDYKNIERIKESSEVNLSESKSLVRKMKKAYMTRGAQADQVKKALSQSPYPLVICGDFNDVPNSYTYFTIRQSLQDA
ncbi:MAG: hypothetical protein EAZ62_05515, partial [Sphingobacteriia bacterium]